MDRDFFFGGGGKKKRSHYISQNLLGEGTVPPPMNAIVGFANDAFSTSTTNQKNVNVDYCLFQKVGGGSQKGFPK